MWTATVRNMDSIQFETIRKQIDKKYNDLHDELSDCYYNKKAYKEYGVLDKATFDKLHALVFCHRDIEFHSVNMAQDDEKLRIPESEYNEIESADKTIVKKTDIAAAAISSCSKEGVTLEVK